MKKPPTFFSNRISAYLLIKVFLSGQILLILQVSSIGLYAQQLSIKGKVTNEAGSGLAGVSVKVDGTNKGTYTSENGEYSIGQVTGNASLLFSSVGFTSQQTNVDGRNRIDIVLQENNTKLGEVIVVGYGTQKKATVTGSIVAVKGEKLQASPAINFTNTLAGRLPGLVTVNYSGEPGNDNATIRIRGSNTLGDNSPLVVIDGVANRTMDGLDPSVVESITVLKDASAAIYGAQAANGVILITTKRGALGKPGVNVRFDYGLSAPTIIPKMADAPTYATMINEINSYAGRPATYTADEIRKFGDGSDPWLYPNTDWFDVVFKSVAKQNNTNITVSGGTENMKYFIAAGFNQQGAIYKNSDRDYSRVNFRSNIDGKISNHIYLSFDVAGRQESRNLGPTGNIFTYLINRSKPIFIANYPGNKPATGYEAGANPVVLTSNLVGYNKSKTYNFSSNVKLLVTIPWVKGLSVTTNASFDKDINNVKAWATPYTLYSWDRVTYDANKLPVVTGALSGPSLDASLTQSMTDGQRILLNALVNYDVRLTDKHTLKVLAGVEKIMGESMDLSAFRRGYVSTAIDQIFAGASLAKDNGGSATQSARLNYFGRLNYDYLQKYLLEFVWRYDGSYIFSEKKRFGFFPGISAGWKISEENFWKNNLSFINSFKFRGSWGQTGNDRIAAYQYLSSYGFGVTPYVLNGNLEVQPLNELRIANPNVTWEVANQSNIGFDGEMFEGKFQFSAEYFYNLRSNILSFRNASVPVSTGLTLPRENIGEVINQGYEIQVGYKSNIGKFKYEVSANGAVAKNKIKFWDEVSGVPEYQRSTGRPMNAGLYYNAKGVFRDQAAVDKSPHWANARPGDIIFEDVNNDTKIDGKDRVRSMKTDIPTFTGGVSIDLGYKNFYASILFQGASGAVRSYNLESGAIGDFLEDDANGRWTVNNPDAKKPRTWNTGGEYWSSVNNTYWLKNNDYLRLKNLQVGYNVPKNLSDKLKINGLSIYITGLNLVTFSPEKTFDPETVGNVYPLSRVINGGINLTF
ncbi:MAG: TonB-dependent receptor [Chitinophagaceae bacterium]